MPAVNNFFFAPRDGHFAELDGHFAWRAGLGTKKKEDKVRGLQLKKKTNMRGQKKKRLLQQKTFPQSLYPLSVVCFFFCNWVK
jgi:hypothetical protein